MGPESVNIFRPLVQLMNVVEQVAAQPHTRHLAGQLSPIIE